MNVTLDYLTGNRKWLVRDYAVWGDSGALDATMIATEMDESNKRVTVFREMIGGEPQVVEFTDLVDHRGNRLPETIANAAIVIIPKNGERSFIIGTAGPSSFRIARAPGSGADSNIDLLIMEMN